MNFLYRYTFIVLSLSIITAVENVDIECRPLPMSYIRTNEAIALMNGMGYNVIEFNKSDTLNNFIPTDSLTKLPAIITFPTLNNGFLDPFNGAGGNEYYNSESQFDFSSYLGGSSFPELLSSSPLEQLLICYDEANLEPYFNLIEYIKNYIDVPAKQIMIDAMVIEINSSELESLEYDLSKGDTSSFSLVNSINDLTFSMGENGIYTEAGQTILDEIDFQLRAIIQNNSTEILSKPSVLVLDGRQARIQVGEQIPISKLPMSNAQDLFVVPDVEYLPVGITLNIRPRISNDNKYVTMQVETIISEVAGGYSNSQSSVIDAPIINNRKIESFVRLANNTPFIVGGLISNKQSDGKSRIPLLSKIPILGNLFKQKSSTQDNREVIIVITPHVIEDNYSEFSKVVPQDSEIFNSFGSILFSNSYRLKESDIFDLDFITQSDKVLKLRQTLNSNRKFLNNKYTESIKSGLIPGEDILVRRMIYEIIRKSNYYSYINSENIIFFNQEGGIERLKDYDNIFTKKGNSLLLSLTEDKEESSFTRPFLETQFIDTQSNYLLSLRKYNESRKSILLSDSKHRRILLESIILKHLLEMNEDLELSLSTFRRGLEIQFPNPTVFEDNFHLIDADIISYYYEIYDYYNVFENKFENVYNQYID